MLKCFRLWCVSLVRGFDGQVSGQSGRLALLSALCCNYIMKSCFDWSRIQRETRLRKRGGEAIDGRPIGHSEKSKSVGQASINGPSHVSRQYGRVRSVFLGRVRLAMANGGTIPTTAGLPANIAKEVNILGGPLAWANAQPDTHKIVKKIQRRLKTNT